MRQAKLGTIPHNKGKQMPMGQRVRLSCSNRNMDISGFNGFADKKQRALDYLRGK